jgi:hypothetical protein
MIEAKAIGRLTLQCALTRQASIGVLCQVTRPITPYVEISTLSNYSSLTLTDRVL